MNINWKSLEPYRESGVPWDVLEPILLQSGDMQAAIDELAKRGFKGAELGPPSRAELKADALRERVNQDPPRKLKPSPKKRAKK
jgi:hypothetical protein